MTSQDKLKRTPLFEEHIRCQAKMVPFGGWEMPVQYEGILAEYEQTRNRCSLFDTSHMGEFTVDGDCVETGLDRLVSMSLADLPVKTCRYGILPNGDGGVIDDLIVFRVDQRKWFIVVNGGTTEKDANHFLKHLSEKTVFKDLSTQTGKLDLQGPLSRDVLKDFINGIEKLDYFSFDFFNLLGKNVLISRTGYTGELGYEIFFPWDSTVELWNALLKNDKVKPAGLGARDVLRLEMGYSLYGHELGEDISPLEAGLKRFINFDKDFIGKPALLEEVNNGMKRKLIGFISENRRSPRGEQILFNENGNEIGVVTSGTFSPSLKNGIGLGFVQYDQASKGEKIFFGSKKQKIAAKVTGRSFYNNGSLKI